MKHAFTLTFFVFSLNSFSQAKEPLKNQSNTSDIVTFTAKLDITYATKDGVYLNGYVVNIGYEQAKKLDGKKIRVTGKMTIIKGIKNDRNNDIKQGRETDTKYIVSPKISIIEN